MLALRLSAAAMPGRRMARGMASAAVRGGSEGAGGGGKERERSRRTGASASPHQSPSSSSSPVSSSPAPSSAGAKKSSSSSSSFPALRTGPQTTVGSLLEAAAARHPDRDAFHDVTQRLQWTFREVQATVDRHAHGLIEARCGVGDCVAALLRNEPETYVSALASARAGLRWAPLPAATAPTEAGPLLRRLDARAFIFYENFYDPHLLAMVPELNEPEYQLYYNRPLRSRVLPALRAPIHLGRDRLQGALQYREVGVKDAAPGLLPRLARQISATAPALVVPAPSATTSSFSHAALVNAAEQMASALGLSVNDRIAQTLPHWWPQAVVAGPLAALASNAVLVNAAPGATAEASSVAPALLSEQALLWARGLEASQATVLLATPASLQALLQCPLLSRKSLTAMRLIVLFHGPLMSQSQSVDTAATSFDIGGTLSELTTRCRQQPAFAQARVLLAASVPQSAAPVFLHEAAEVLGPVSPHLEARIDSARRLRLRGYALQTEGRDADGWVDVPQLRLQQRSDGAFALSP